ncbi:MAG: biotin/lipoyl-containing protein [Opitutaceae bacterium]|jgi:biotin carboxyl carrier protein
MKKLRITVEGRAYDVTVEVLEEGRQSEPVFVPVASASVSAPVSGAKLGSAPAASAGDVLSPLSGKLVSIEVKLGQQVTDGQQVATIEAMKMNTYIYASRSGKVEAIAGQPGDAIQEGAIILRIA